MRPTFCALADAVLSARQNILDYGLLTTLDLLCRLAIAKVLGVLPVVI